MKKYCCFIFLMIMLFPLIVLAEEVEVSTIEELQTALNNGSTEIAIKDDFSFNSTITINGSIKINGNNHTLNRDSNFLGNLFKISETGSLELNSLVIDGGAPGWKMDIENRYYTEDTRSAYVRFPTISDENDIVATHVAINNSGNLIINNSKFQNMRCTSTGCLIYGKGNNTINESEFNHICSSKNGGVMYVTGGETKISESTFKDNASGCGVTTSTQGGAIYITGASLIEVKDNTVFDDNIAQNNSGAIYIVKTNTLIEDSKFTKNKCGNDGSSLTLSSTTSGNSVLIQNTEFDGNYGYATRGQSLGTIWLQKWLNDEEHPVVFKNLVFKNNTVATGAAISDNGGDATFVSIENIESYGNHFKNGGAFYFQGTIAKANNLNIHDNECIFDGWDDDKTCRGAAFYMRSASPVEINNMTVTNNEGSGVCVLAGKIDINNSTITNNAAKIPDGGGGIQIKGTEVEPMVNMTITNTTISNNTSVSYGGGISIIDNEDVFSKVTIDDQSKIYDNKADISGDDFAYRRTNNTENNTNNSITLDNISIAGITGIDGWYHDEENERYMNTENPTVFNEYIDYTGYGLYLKAGGLNSLDYDLVEGENEDITPVVIRYGVPYIVTDEEPVKDGYDFVGWNTKPDGSGISLQSGDEYDGREGYVLYAQYIVSRTNPPTSDKVIYFISLLFISILSLFGVILVTREKEN